MHWRLIRSRKKKRRKPLLASVIFVHLVLCQFVGFKDAGKPRFFLELFVCWIASFFPVGFKRAIKIEKADIALTAGPSTKNQTYRKAFGATD